MNDIVQVQIAALNARRTAYQQAISTITVDPDTRYMVTVFTSNQAFQVGSAVIVGYLQALIKKIDQQIAAAQAMQA